MKAIMVALLVLWLAASQAFAAKECDQFRASITTGTMGVTEKVAAIPNKRIYLCGYMIIRASGGQDLEFQLTSGTGVGCATNTTVILPRMDVPLSGIVNRLPIPAGEVKADVHAMCVQALGNGSVTSVFYWAQF
jgi:hypothetical protein